MYSPHNWNINYLWLHTQNKANIQNIDISRVYHRQHKWVGSVSVSRQQLREQKATEPKAGNSSVCITAEPELYSTYMTLLYFQAP